MYSPKMELTLEQREILEGKQGPTMAKIMETVVMFGDIFSAPRLVKVTHDDGHLVTSFGIKLLKPLFSTMEQINEAGIKTKGNFTVDPRPIDYENVKCNLLEKLVFSKVMYAKQEMYEDQMKKVCWAKQILGCLLTENEWDTLELHDGTFNKIDRIIDEKYFNTRDFCEVLEESNFYNVLACAEDLIEVEWIFDQAWDYMVALNKVEQDLKNTGVLDRQGRPLD